MTDHHGTQHSQLAPSTGGLPSDEVVATMLRSWLPAQRWFAGDGTVASGMRIVRRETLFEVDEVTAEWVVVGTEGAITSYSVPLVWRPEPLPDHIHARIGEQDGLTCYDGLHDGATTDALYDSLISGEALGPLTSHPMHPAPAGLPGTALDREQSNTSVVHADQVIVKYFRRLAPGINPEADVARALVACPRTTDPVGELRMELGGEQTTVAFATQFVTNCVDGWSMATTSVRDLMFEGDLRADEVGGDFAAEAHRLGRAVAEVHGALAEAFGSQREPGSAAAIITGMIDRVDRTVQSIPVLRSRAARILDTFERLRTAAADAPVVRQRIHGDLHLGQVLRTVDGWLVIDFEGEPSRPVAQRRAAAPVLQDIAGMLRSFHYAAHYHLHLAGDDPQRSYRAAEWVQRNSAAFVAGYAEAGEDPLQSAALLTAFQLDKAVYEVGYEHGHRPGWEEIPLAAITELTG